MFESAQPDERNHRLPRRSCGDTLAVGSPEQPFLVQFPPPTALRRVGCENLLVHAFGLIAVVALPGAAAWADDVIAPVGADPDRYNVVWDSPSKDSRGSMPLGNGDIALNAWVEPNGDLLFYIAKSDAVSENSQLLKLGRIRVEFTPSLIAARSSTKARHSNKNCGSGRGEIVITGGIETPIEVRLWVDANRPVIELEASGPKPFEMQANLELWRNEKRDPRAKGPGSRRTIRVTRWFEPVVFDPDTVLPAKGNKLVWYHRDETFDLSGRAEKPASRIAAAKISRPAAASDLRRLHERQGFRRGWRSGNPLDRAGDESAAVDRRRSRRKPKRPSNGSPNWPKMTAAAEAVDPETARKAHDRMVE